MNIGLCNTLPSLAKVTVEPPIGFIFNFDLLLAASPGSVSVNVTTEYETLDMDKFKNLGVIKNDLNFKEYKLEHFISVINNYQIKNKWNKENIVDLFHEMIPDFGHRETGKYLDGKM